jgi:murein DD-endopeptidase MepM/ murein hydrolase activator NlpD
VTGRTFGIVAAVAAAIGLLCLAGPAVLVGGVLTASCGPADAASSTTIGVAPMDGWDGEQVANARIIVDVGVEMGVPARGWVIAVATAMQESGLRNLPGGDRDSIGLFQQRPSQGWGMPAQLADPAYQARRFFDKLLTVDGWLEMSLTEAAQLVQVSAYPQAYAKWEDDATAVVRAVAGEGLAACLEIGSGGWVLPVDGPVVSGFRPPERPGHDGIDIAAPKGATIRAAAAGVVTVVECNASLGGRAFSCDVDGSPSVKGCGWYSEIRHQGEVTTRYCHQLVRPAIEVGQPVVAGQPIGVVGTSGHSSGPHLHFEIHRGYPASEANAVDPVGFLRSVGVEVSPLAR